MAQLKFKTSAVMILKLERYQEKQEEFLYLEKSTVALCAELGGCLKGT